MKFEKLDSSVIKDISNDEPEWFVSDRLRSLELFNQAKDDSFTYGLTMKTDISKINVSDYSSKMNLVIKNKDDRIIVKDFKEAFNDESDLIKKYFMKSIKTKMELLHRSLVQNGLLIYIPRNVKVKKELILDYEFLNNSFDHILIVADINSEINVIEKLTSNEVFRSNIVEIYAKDNSKVNFYSLQDLDENSNNFSIKRSFVGKDATCNFFSFDFGSLLNFNNVYSELVDEGANSKIYETYFSNNNQQFNLACSMHHKSNNTNSNIYTKGVLDDKSNTIYRGLVKIYENAENSNGYQKEDALILSEDSKADSIPNLEINNYDVKCSHGSSIGHIDKDKLFYLMSRGISKEDSVKLVVDGFLGEIIDYVSNEELREELKIKVIEKIK